MVLTGLKPATTYYYQIVSGNSTVERFLSPRAPGDPTSFNISVVVDLGVYGDNGYTVNDNNAASGGDLSPPSVTPDLYHTTIARLAETIDEYEVVIHPGDFAYADDWYYKPKNLLSGTETYQAILEKFYDQLAPIASRKVYQASPGNHEADCTEIPYTAQQCPAGQYNFTDFQHRFGNMLPPAFPSSSTSKSAQALAAKARQLSKPPFWYSFEYASAHVVMIDTETDFPTAPDGLSGSQHLQAGPFGTPNQQIDFLKADLASIDRTITPWVIVAGHRPWYTTTTDDSSECAPCRQAFEDVLYQYGVDVGVFGHVHNSQRFMPVYQNKADPNGLSDPKAPMYIVSGGTGNIEGRTSVGTKQSYNAFAYADEFSYATLNIKDRSHLQVNFYKSTSGELLDSSVLYKKHDDSFVVQ